MTRTVRPACLVTGIVVYLLLTTCGCQNDRARTPTTTVEPPAQTAPVGEPVAPSQSAMPEPEKAQEEVTPQAEQPEETLPEPNEVGQPVDLVLRFSPGQVATYKVITEIEKRVEWIGPESVKPASYAGGRSGNFITITFEQQVKDVQANGNAILEITIRALRYVGRMQDSVVFEFDSAAGAQNEDNDLASLIGTHYAIEMSPRGEVVALLDMESSRQAVKPGSRAHNIASKLLSDETVRDRHAVPPLIALKDEHVSPGQSWSDLKAFSFREMGEKGFERIYTFKRVRADESRSALVEMKAIPSAAMAEEMHERRSASLPPGLFDNADDYRGFFELDLDSGWIREYGEEMWTEWVIVDPNATQEVAQPVGVKMGARQLYQLKLVQSP